MVKRYGSYIVATQPMSNDELLDWLKESTPVMIEQIRGTSQEIRLNLDTLQFIVHTGGETKYAWKCEAFSEGDDSHD